MAKPRVNLGQSQAVEPTFLTAAFNNLLFETYYSGRNAEYTDRVSALVEFILIPRVQITV